MPNDKASTPQVLVVEDDDHIAQVLRFMLERQGYRVTQLPAATIPTPANEAGANDFVIKPFQPNELLARVRRFLRPAA